MWRERGRVYVLFVCERACVGVRVHVGMCVCVCAFAYVCACVFACVFACVVVCVCLRVCLRVLCVCARVQISFAFLAPNLHVLIFFAFEIRYKLVSYHF